MKTGEAFLLDNSDIQDWWNHSTGSQALGSSLGVDAIGEFQTLTNTYSAQFGGNGSVLNAVSKSGTNSFHGSAYEFLRNSALDARNFFDRTASPPAFRRNQFGGAIGGPVKKDKAFFFVNYEGLDSSKGQTVTAFVPDANARQGYLPCSAATAFACNTATGLAYVGISPSVASTMALYPATALTTSTGVAQIPQVGTQVAHENYMLARMDYNFSDKDSLFVRYVRDTANQVSPFPGAVTIGDWPEKDLTASHFVALEERHILSPTLVNLVRVNFNRPNDSGITIGQTPPLNFWPGSGWQNGSVTVSGLTTLGAASLLPFSLILNKFVESDDVILTHGAHSVTFGASVNRQQDNGSGPNNQSGTFAFTSLLNFMTAKPTSLIGGVPGQYDPARSIRETQFAFYVNDSWKATSKLTVNLGLRYEPATNPTEVNGNFHTLLNPPYGSFQQVNKFFVDGNPYMKDFDPRIGFAYDPFKDHKTSIRGGFGMFHDQSTARFLGPCTFGTPPSVQLTQLNPTYPLMFTSTSPSIPQIGPGCDQTTKTTPYIMQYNLNVQRDIGFGTILTVGFVGSRGVHLGDTLDENAPLTSGNAFGTYASIVNGVFVTNPRPNPAFSTEGVTQLGGGLSRYDSLQISIRRRLTHNWQAQLSYTGSHSMDIASGYWGEGGTFAGGLENPLHANWDWGTSSFNRANVITANSVYVLPFNQNMLVRGWQVSGIFTYTSGAPLNVTNGINQTWTPQNTPERPNYISGCDWHNGTVAEWYNPNCFAAPAVGMIGNLGRFALLGPGLVNTDFSLMKDTKIPKISEQFHVQFRAEFFNLFNHANFALPGFTNFTGGETAPVRINPTAGVITATTTNSRQTQFGLRVVF